MGSGAILLAVGSAVVILDSIVALRFRSLADRVENGEQVSSQIDPVQARKTANALLIGAPFIWLVLALIAFGVFPASGIEPIKF